MRLGTRISHVTLRQSVERGDYNSWIWGIIADDRAIDKKVPGVETKTRCKESGLQRTSEKGAQRIVQEGAPGGSDRGKFKVENNDLGAGKQGNSNPNFRLGENPPVLKKIPLFKLAVSLRARQKIEKASG